MAQVHIQHKIGRWSEFESVFRDDGERRRRLGSKGGKVFRDSADPANVFIVLEWDTVENARRFAEGLETHEAMQWATSGVSSSVYVVEEALEVDA